MGAVGSREQGQGCEAGRAFCSMLRRRDQLGSTSASREPGRNTDCVEKQRKQPMPKEDASRRSGDDYSQQLAPLTSNIPSKLPLRIHNIPPHSPCSSIHSSTTFHPSLSLPPTSPCTSPSSSSANSSNNRPPSFSSSVSITAIAKLGSYVNSSSGVGKMRGNSE